MLPMHIGYTHADICMRVAEEAKARQKPTTTAAAHDQLLQKKMADMCVKGLSNFDPAHLMTTFDRELFEQACQHAEQKIANASKHPQEGWKQKFHTDRSNANAPFHAQGRGYGGSWNKRQADNSWKSKDFTKKKKF